jgi:hypothetical protein
MNLNAMRGILITCLASTPSNLITPTEYLLIETAQTHEFLAKPRPFVARITRQTSPNFNFSL